MTEKKTHIIILAAGQGTRLNSKLPKVMHKVGGLPLVGHVLRTARASASAPLISLVLAPSMDTVATFAKKVHPEITLCYQDPPLGTGHAVSCALETLGKSLQPQDCVIILFGDTPLIQTDTLDKVHQTLNQTEASLVVVGMHVADPKSYGRLVCTPEGRLVKIVEARDASPAEQEIQFCNSGIMGFQAQCLQDVLPKIQACKGEYYLTAAIEQAHAQGYILQTLAAPSEDVEGVNTRADLAQAEAVFQRRAREKALARGCTLLDPASVYFSYDTAVSADTVIEPHVFFGESVTLDEGTTVRAFSYLEGTHLKKGATVGPFARLRPHTEIGENARIGNFVEVKNTTLGPKAKANHLSYLGDASIGEGANIGAGTITCNYDGYDKHKTTIGAGAFIGSNTSLVAPIQIGQNALIAAGSTLTQDVPAEALALGRADQKILDQKARLVRLKKEQTFNKKVG